MNSISLIRWAGGKGRQLNELLPLIPYSRCYTEPFAGGISVLLNRSRSPIEVVNDLDGSLVNLFQVVRDDESFDEFVRYVDWTLYSRAEFESCFLVEEWANPVKRAAAFYTIMNQGISGKRLAIKSEWSRSMQDNLPERWKARIEKLGWIHRRLEGVLIECRDALDVLEEFDADDTVHYCDPPYVLDTRSKIKYYAVEPGDEYHERLVDLLLQLKGMVVLSGYDHPIYTRLRDHGWVTDLSSQVASMYAHKGNKPKRVEIVYRNPHAAEMGVARPLFTYDERVLDSSGLDIGEVEVGTVAAGAEGE